ncbi:MAG: hypothetical protein RSA53_10620 [Odoribacter sp.]
MNLRDIFLKYSTYFLGNISELRDDYYKGLEFMKKLPEPVDDIERSHHQYRCQRFFQPYQGRILFDTISFFLFFPILFWSLVKKRYNKNAVQINNAVYIRSATKEAIGIVPECIVNEFNVIHYCSLGVFFLEKKDILFIYNIWKKYPFSPFFLFKNMLNIASYRFIINKYNPNAIIALSEYSFTSSILTLFCERNGVELINIMHGERLLEIRASFFRFHRCFVWDQHYIDIFKKLRAFSNQFKIELPPALKIDVSKWRKQEIVCDFKYYLTTHSDIELQQISNALEILCGQGYKVKVRPHPRYCNLESIKKYFRNEWIESLDVCIEESVANTEAVIGVYSTVMLQSYLCGRKIVLDDVNYKTQIERLTSVDYILLNKSVEVLSSYLNAKNNK